jgi:hypothetical protein
MLTTGVRKKKKRKIIVWASTSESSRDGGGGSSGQLAAAAASRYVLGSSQLQLFSQMFLFYSRKALVYLLQSKQK